MNLNLLLTFTALSSLLSRSLQAESFLDTDILENVDSSASSHHIASHHRQLQTVGTLFEVMNAGDLIRITGDNLDWTSAQPSDYSIFHLPLPPVEGTVLSQDSTCFVYTLTPTFIQTACSYSELVNDYFVDCVAETSVYSSSACTNAITGGPTFAPTVVPTVAPTVYPTVLPTAPLPGTLTSLSNNGGKLRLDGVGLTWLGTNRFSYNTYRASLPFAEGATLTSPCAITSISATFVQTGCGWGTASYNAYWVECSAGVTVYSSTVCTNAMTAGPTFAPTQAPTIAPTSDPTFAPTNPTPGPTASPTNPTAEPTLTPTLIPSEMPTQTPTISPSVNPSMSPSFSPSAVPTEDPSALPTIEPTLSPSDTPTRAPTLTPTENPSENPTLAPTTRPSADPTVNPSASPSLTPTSDPSVAPTIAPTVDPTVIPTAQPTPTGMPTYPPSAKPTVRPTKMPTAGPSFFNPPLQDSHNKTANVTTPLSAAKETAFFTETSINRGMLVGASLLTLGASYLLWRRCTTKDTALNNDLNFNYQRLTNSDVKEAAYHA